MKVCLVIVVLLQYSAVEFCMKLEHVNKSVYLYMLGSSHSWLPDGVCDLGTFVQIFHCPKINFNSSYLSIFNIYSGIPKLLV